MFAGSGHSTASLTVGGTVQDPEVPRAKAALQGGAASQLNRHQLLCAHNARDRASCPGAQGAEPPHGSGDGSRAARNRPPSRTCCGRTSPVLGGSSSKHPSAWVTRMLRGHRLDTKGSV